MAIREVSGDEPAKNVYVVLRSNDPPPPGDLKDIFTARHPVVSIEGIYEDELDAAKKAGSSQGTWYIEQPLTPSSRS